jgi:hypothetical protein
MNSVIFLLALLTASPPDAQQAPQPGGASSRAELLAGIREQKARKLEPYQPGKLEKLLIKVENDRLIEDFLATGSGFYIRSGKLTTGAGLAFGPGYKRRDLLGGNMAVDVSAAGSIRKYWMANASVKFPRLWRGRAEAEFYGRHADFPQEDFYGLGPESDLEDQVSFLYRDTLFGASLRSRLLPFLLVGGTAERLSPSVGAGRDSRVPTLDALFTPDQAPGYTDRAEYMRYEARADLNYAQPVGNPRDGGRYLVAYNRYDDIDQGLHGFNRVDLDLRQYLSFWKSRRVFVLRGYYSSARPNSDAEVVPFYMMQTLGGHNTLRGFRNYRFRDTHVLLMQVEYRWEIFPALDAALFYDTGKVSPTRSDLFENLEHDYGIGFRFGTNAGVFMRIDVSFGGSEGGKLFWRWGNVF